MGMSECSRTRNCLSALVHDADADLTLAASRLTVGGESYRDLQAHLFASGGKLVLNPARVTAPGGVMIGALTLDAGIDPSPVALTLRAPSMSASRVASLLGFAGGATGQMQVDAQLSGVGDTPACAGGECEWAYWAGDGEWAVHRGFVSKSDRDSVEHRGGSADFREVRMCGVWRCGLRVRAGQGSRGGAGAGYVPVVVDRDWDRLIWMRRRWRCI